MGHDFFICHASEDKETVARPLAERLDAAGYKIWLDETEILVGDSLSQKIDKGLIESRYGIVVLSPSFFKKNWPQKELDGLWARETKKRKVILPVWHKISRDEILKYSPMLAGRFAASTEKGIEHVAEQILRVIGAGSTPSRQSIEAASTPRKFNVSALIFATFVCVAGLTVLFREKLIDEARYIYPGVEQRGPIRRINAVKWNLDRVKITGEGFGDQVGIVSIEYFLNGARFVSPAKSIENWADEQIEFLTPDSLTNLLKLDQPQIMYLTVKPTFIVTTAEGSQIVYNYYGSK